MQQRKFRNTEEKQQIVEEARKNLQSYFFDETTNEQLDQILNAFMIKQTGCISGSFPIDGTSKMFEYYLPTRRVQKQYIRIVNAST